MGNDENRHRPVMIDEILEALRLHDGGLWVDATLGEAGFAAPILKATAPGGRLLGVDWDQEALDLSRKHLEPYKDRTNLIRGSFAYMADYLKELGWSDGVDGVVADLGLSTRHILSAERGFSFMKPGPLDMRMDRSAATTAADLANALPERELANLIYRFGEERASRRIAHAIVSTRIKSPLKTTDDLKQVVRSAGVRGRPGHDPATRTFQAFRIAVNGELDALEIFLDRGWELLRPCGRLLVLTYHSLEDRMVKQAMRRWACSCLCPIEQPVCNCGWTPKVKLLWRRKQTPTEDETRLNPRARSAGLRGVERLAA